MTGDINFISLYT